MRPYTYFLAGLLIATCVIQNVVGISSADRNAYFQYSNHFRQNTEGLSGVGRGYFHNEPIGQQSASINDARAAIHEYGVEDLHRIPASELRRINGLLDEAVIDARARLNGGLRPERVRLEPLQTLQADSVSWTSLLLQLDDDRVRNALGHARGDMSAFDWVRSYIRAVSNMSILAQGMANGLLQQLFHDLP
ncbi:hypothetical protein BCV70DRAFT_231814 [Testicularia cyperi]|uniref:Uncharacterized protein n=1 Tax=Testicularia cyperi TaxID=1882483 RepID=A0A317XQK7_9BASI|nr:hypothetical protein BCV70DRAFT_231814 [Testicularia cyperi]